MTTPNPFDLATALPALTSAIAEGVRQGNAATDTGGPAAADQMSAMLQIAASPARALPAGRVAGFGPGPGDGQGRHSGGLPGQTVFNPDTIPSPSPWRQSDAEVSQYDLQAVMAGRTQSGDYVRRKQGSLPFH